MDFIRDCYESIIDTISSKIFRVFFTFILTMTIAIVEVIYGVRSHSNALIADGLFSFAEGISLIGVMIVLHLFDKERNRPTRNTFGHERLELLIGLLQEVFLLSISFGIIVDAINHLVNPSHIHEPGMMVIIGGIGIIVGILGMIMFSGYHHTHDIEEEIHENKKRDSMPSTKENKEIDEATTTSVTIETEVIEPPLVLEEKSSNTSLKIPSEKRRMNISPSYTAALATFTYENVQIGESRVYATLHALCLHSFVVLLESVIVTSSGLLIKIVPHLDPSTGKEINHWLKYIDPSLTLIMVLIIIIRAIPVIFSLSAILIENVPAGIDTQELMKEIVRKVPAIKSIHSLHIWRATATEIYATLHLVCDEDVPLSTCTNEYSETIKAILKSSCIRYFTLQFEYVKPARSGQSMIYRCVHGLHRKRRGHQLEEPMTKFAMINIR